MQVKVDIRAKIAAIKEYLSGQGSYAAVAKANGMGETTLVGWVRRYREQGESGFVERSGNRRYSKEFKIMCVEAVISGAGSVNDIVAKYNISARELLRSWLKCYNANMELKDYEPEREVYMAEARRKQHGKSVRKSLTIASVTTRTIKELQPSTRYLTARYIPGSGNIVNVGKEVLKTGVAITKQIGK